MHQHIDINAPISCVKNCRQKQTHDSTLSEIASDIIGGKYSVQVDRVRAAVGDAAGVRKAKLQLSAFIAAGKFTKRSNDALEVHSGLICMDFDHVEDINAAKANLNTDKHTLFTFVSPSGTGLKAIVAIEPATNANEHGAAFDAAKDYFLNQYNLMADPSGRDPARLCFFSYDPEARLKDSAEVILRDGVTHTPHTHCLNSLNSPMSSALSMLSMSSMSHEDIINITLPTAPGQRHRSVMKLARGLHFEGGMADTPLKQIKPIVRRWFDCALPVISTKDFDETWSDFVHAWPRVKTPLTESAITLAWQKVKEGNMPEIADQYENENVRKLVALCYQLGHGKESFYLAMRTAANLIEVSHPQTIQRWLVMLRVDEVIELLKKGTRHTASTYRWIK